jgi:hypothetical protein
MVRMLHELAGWLIGLLINKDTVASHGRTAGYAKAYLAYLVDPPLEAVEDVMWLQWL